MKKNLRKFIVLFVVLSIVVTSLVVPEREVKAQSYPRYSFSMSIKDGEACIVINGNHAYQLTKEKFKLKWPVIKFKKKEKIQ